MMSAFRVGRYSDAMDCAQLENHDGDQQPPVRPQVFNKQFPQQGGSKGSVPQKVGADVSLRPEAGQWAGHS